MTRRIRTVVAGALLLAIAGATGAPPTGHGAERASRARRFSEVRARYRTVADRIPAASSTVWAARAPGWLHDDATLERTFDAALAVDPTDVDALLGKAYVLAWQGRSSEAGVVVGRASLLAPDRVDVHFAGAWRAVLAGAPDDAHPHLARVLALDPTNAAAHELRRALPKRAPARRDSFLARVRRLLGVDETA